MVACMSWLGSLHAAGPVISEFVALNQTSLRDANGESSDWIELVNASATATNLAGWHLTDDATRPAKWTFPDTPLGPGEFLVVFASGKNRAVAGQELHTNFRLSNEGEYLALTRPENALLAALSPAEGRTVLQAIAAAFGPPRDQTPVNREAAELAAEFWRAYDARRQ